MSLAEHNLKPLSHMLCYSLIFWTVGRVVCVNANCLNYSWLPYCVRITVVAVVFNQSASDDTMGVTESLATDSFVW